MKWYRPSTWSERSKGVGFTIGIGLVLLTLVAAVGRTTLENDYLSRFTCEIVGGRTIVCKMDNIPIGDTTPAAGTFTTLSSTGAGTFQGANTFGVGIQGLGYVVADSAETTTGDSVVGTLTTIALPGSSTCYVEADVMGRADTSTGYVMYRIEGTFDRDGTNAMASGGTDTQWFSGSLDLTVDDQTEWAAYFVADTDGSDNAIQLVVEGTDTKIQWTANVKSITVTTTGGL